MQKENWSPSSWRTKKAKHMPVYSDKEKLSSVLKILSDSPPLVFAGEARNLQNQLAEVEREAFVRLKNVKQKLERIAKEEGVV